MTFSTVLIFPAAALLSSLSVLCWNTAPPSWLCDYSPSPVECEYAKNRRAFTQRGLFLTGFLLFLILFWPKASLSCATLLLLFCLFQLALADLSFGILQDEWILLLACSAAFSEEPPTARALLFAILIPLLWIAADLLCMRLRKESAAGFGDAKLAAALIAACGSRQALHILLIASLLCGMVSAVLLLFRRKKTKDPIAFGPFVFAAALCYFASISAIAAARRSMFAV